MAASCQQGPGNISENFSIVKTMNFNEICQQLLNQLEKLLESSSHPVQKDHILEVSKAYKLLAKCHMQKHDDLKLFIRGIVKYLVVLIEFSQCFKDNQKWIAPVRYALGSIKCTIDSLNIHRKMVKKFVSIVDALSTDYAESICLKDLLKLYNVLLSSVPKSVTDEIMDHHKRLDAVANIVKQGDDVEKQAVVIEILLTICNSKKNLKRLSKLLPEGAIDREELKPNRYQDIRRIMNQVNEKSNNIFSIHCSSIILDRLLIKESTDCTSQNSMWCDFNLLKLNISFFCDKNYLSRYTDVNFRISTTWEVLCFNAKDVTKSSFYYNSSLNTLSIVLKLKASSFNVFANIETDLIQTLTIVISCGCKNFKWFVSSVLPSFFPEFYWDKLLQSKQSDEDAPQSDLLSSEANSSPIWTHFQLPKIQKMSTTTTERPSKSNSSSNFKAALGIESPMVIVSEDEDEDDELMQINEAQKRRRELPISIGGHENIPKIFRSKSLRMSGKQTKISVKNKNVHDANNPFETSVTPTSFCDSLFGIRREKLDIISEDEDEPLEQSKKVSVLNKAFLESPNKIVPSYGGITSTSELAEISNAHVNDSFMKVTQWLNKKVEEAPSNNNDQITLDQVSDMNQIVSSKAVNGKRGAGSADPKHIVGKLTNSSCFSEDSMPLAQRLVTWQIKKKQNPSNAPNSLDSSSERIPSLREDPIQKGKKLNNNRNLNNENQELKITRELQPNMAKDTSESVEISVNVEVDATKAPIEERHLSLSEISDDDITMRACNPDDLGNLAMEWGIDKAECPTQPPQLPEPLISPKDKTECPTQPPQSPEPLISSKIRNEIDMSFISEKEILMDEIPIISPPQCENPEMETSKRIHREMTLIYEKIISSSDLDNASPKRSPGNQFDTDEIEDMLLSGEDKKTAFPRDKFDTMARTVKRRCLYNPDNYLNELKVEYIDSSSNSNDPDWKAEPKSNNKRNKRTPKAKNPIKTEGKSVKKTVKKKIVKKKVESKIDNIYPTKSKCDGSGLTFNNVFDNLKASIHESKLQKRANKSRGRQRKKNLVSETSSPSSMEPFGVKVVPNVAKNQSISQPLIHNAMESNESRSTGSKVKILSDVILQPPHNVPPNAHEGAGCRCCAQMCSLISHWVADNEQCLSRLHEFHELSNILANVIKKK